MLEYLLETTPLPTVLVMVMLAFNLLETTPLPTGTVFHTSWNPKTASYRRDRDTAALEEEIVTAVVQAPVTDSSSTSGEEER